jgi:hypothetical protein
MVVFFLSAGAFSGTNETNGTAKRCYFQKRTGEVIENTGSRPKNEPERTEKRSGEVVENT